MSVIVPENGWSDETEYVGWLDALAEQEIEEFLAVYEEPFHLDQCQVAAQEAPAIEEVSPAQWAMLYDDVRQYSPVPIQRTTVTIPDQNPFEQIGRAVASTVTHDLACRMQELLEDRGYQFG